MKIDGIELLKKIKNKEIKEGTRINCSRFDYSIHIVYEGGRLNLYKSNGKRYDEDKWTGVISATDLLNYTFEIIEEDKEIEDTRYMRHFEGNGKCYVESKGHKYYVPYDLLLLIDNLTKEVNKIKKEGK